MEGASVNLNGDNLNLSELTDINGQAFFTDINVGNNPDDLLLPGEIDITADAGNLQWYDDMTTDNQTITEGNYNFNYTLQASLNNYIQNLKTENTSGEILGDVNWKLQNNNGSEIYATGVTNTTTGESQINYTKRYPGEMTELELTASKDGYINDTTTTSITPGQINDLIVDLEEETQPPGEAYLWRAGRDELEQNGTTFDIVINSLNYTDTIFAVLNTTSWKDTVPVNQSGTTPVTIKYIPHTINGAIPLYPRTITLNMINGEQATGEDTIYALEQEQKFVINVFDFENEGARKEADVEILDNQNNVVFSGQTIDGVVETNYLPTGDEGAGFEGIVNITPTDNTYFGTRMVVTGGDMTVDDQQNLYNNLGVGYTGYAYVMPEIQADFNKTDTIAFYLIKQKREDPLNPGDSLQMNSTEIREMESNSINTEYARYNEENIFFRETKPTEYDDYRNHARLIPKLSD